MAIVTLRLEAELDKPDMVKSKDAVAEALEAAAEAIRQAPLFVFSDQIEVPRGQVAYLIEVAK